MSKVNFYEAETHNNSNKLCDYVADSIYDFLRKNNPQVLTDIRVASNPWSLLIQGEVGGPYSEGLIANMAKKAIHDQKRRHVLNIKTDPDILMHINRQSPEIAEMVVAGGEAVGASEQCFVTGYAVDSKETNYLPPAVWAANKMVDCVTELGSGLDGKIMITEKGGSFKSVDAYIQARSEAEAQDVQQIASNQWKEILADATGAVSKINIQHFSIGGCHANSGMSGSSVRHYGTYSLTGNSAHSGKDMSKVSRSGSYMARALAKNIVKKTDAKECQVSVAYKVGDKKPIDVCIIVDGEPKNIKGVKDIFDVSYMVEKFGPQHTAHLNHPYVDEAAAWEILELSEAKLKF